MSQYVKYPSRQAGPFSANQNLMDFELPDTNGVYDLSKSFINVMCSVDCANDATGVFEVKPKFGNSGLAFNNVALIRNASMNARRAGKIEDLREIGLFRNTMMAYRKNKSGKESAEYGSLYGFYDNNGFQNSPARRINKYGTVESENVEFPIQLKLSDIFETGRIPEYHVSKWGQTRIHIEAYLEKLGFNHNIHEYLALKGTKTNTKEYTTDAATFASVPNTFSQLVGSQVSLFHSGSIIVRTVVSINEAAGKLVFVFSGDPLPGSNGDVYYAFDGKNVLVCDAEGTATANSHTRTAYDAKPDDFPGFVGQAVEVLNMTQDTNAAVERKITQCLKQADGTVKVVYDDVITAAADGDVLLIRRRGAGNITVSFPSAEIVLKRVINPGPAPDRLQYMTITTEQFTSGTAITNFERMFQLEPEAMNFYVMFPDSDYAYSQDGPSITDVRFRLDNKDLTDRNYAIHKVLYNDRLNMLMLNSGYAVKDIRGVLYSNYELENNDQSDVRATVLGNPVPITQREKLLQINIDSTSGIEQMNVYKQVLRVL